MSVGFTGFNLCQGAKIYNLGGLQNNLNGVLISPLFVRTCLLLTPSNLLRWSTAQLVQFPHVLIGRITGSQYLWYDLQVLTFR